MKNYIFLIIIFFVNFLFAQKDTNLCDKMFKLNIVSPGFSFEKSFTKNSSINLEIGTSIGYNISNNYNGFVTSPFAIAQYRFYYNLESRIKNNKVISGNSGAYVALNSSYYGKAFNSDNLISILDGITFGGVWGFQKTYNSSLNLNANVGLGYNNSENQPKKIVPILNFTIGWVIFK
jgi:hypothetical protein